MSKCVKSASRSRGGSIGVSMIPAETGCIIAFGVIREVTVSDI